MRSRSVIRVSYCYYIFALRERSGLSRERQLAWSIAALLFAGSVINYLDRAVLAVVMPQVRHDLHLTNQEYGWAINAFLTAYMVSYVLGGRLADRFGYRRLVAWTAAFWSLAAIAHTFVGGLAGLAFVRAMLGLGEGGFYPAAMRGVSGWFPPADRAKAVGLFLSALSVGTLLSAPIVAPITGRYGWRTSFLITGGCGFVLLPAWLWLHRRIRRIYGAVEASPTLRRAEEGATQPSLAYVLRTRKFLCTLGARGCSDAAWYFYLFWMPAYFQEMRGMRLDWVGRFLWIPYLGAGLGALIGAWISSGLIHRGYTADRGRKVVMAPAALLAALGATIYFVPWNGMALAIMAAALFGHQAWSSNIHTAISEISPSAHVAVLYGITGAAGTMLGAVAQLAIGPVVDAGGYALVFLGAGLVYALACALLFAAGKIEPIVRPVAVAH